jgi:hypothetical protein
VKTVVVVLLVAVGCLLVHAGEQDDSPGLGGIGLLLAVGALAWAVRDARRSRA